MVISSAATRKTYSVVAAAARRGVSLSADSLAIALAGEGLEGVLTIMLSKLHSLERCKVRLLQCSRFTCLSVVARVQLPPAMVGSRGCEARWAAGCEESDTGEPLRSLMRLSGCAAGGRPGN